MPSTHLIAVFAVACINQNVAAAITIPTAVQLYLFVSATIKFSL
jgi:hypothetical protein